MGYEKLVAAGIDIEGLLKRLMNNDSLVKVFIKKFTEDKTFQQLVDSFEEKDIKKAEMMSHSLKGMCGNLSLTRLYKLFTEQVDLIRSGELSKAENMMTVINEVYSNSIEYMNKWLCDN